jgi:hypothetical protein
MPCDRHGTKVQRFRISRSFSQRLAVELGLEGCRQCFGQLAVGMIFAGKYNVASDNYV